MPIGPGGLAVGFSSRYPPVRVNCPHVDYSTNSVSYVEIGSGWRLTVEIGPSGLAKIEGNLILRMTVLADCDLTLGIDGAAPASGSAAWLGGCAWNGGYMQGAPFARLVTGLPGSHVFSIWWTVSSSTVYLDGASRGAVEMGSYWMVTPLP